MKLYIIFFIFTYLPFCSYSASSIQTPTKRKEEKQLLKKKRKKNKEKREIRILLNTKVRQFIISTYFKKIRKTHNAPKMSRDLIEAALIIIGIGLGAFIIWKFTPFLPIASVLAVLCLSFGFILMIIGLLAKPY